MRTKTLDLPLLCRVEGEGALDIRIKQGRIESLKLTIFEPPRYFEKLLEGRSYHDIPDIVARICGICPVAYQLTAVKAIEQAFETQVSPWVENQRRLLYCGEWIQSHALHVHLLAAPDFLGYDNALALAEDHPEIVRRGLGLQNLGNQIIAHLGGRSVHPVGVIPGGFSRAPTATANEKLLEQIQQAKPQAAELVDWALSVNYPAVEIPILNVALSHAQEYAVYAGDIYTDTAQQIAVADYLQHFQEQHQAHSTALYSYLAGERYLLGPNARIAVNLAQLDREIQNKIRPKFHAHNRFHSLLARCAELYQCLLTAERCLQNDLPEDIASPIVPKASHGQAATEAPRGLLFHHYEFDANGIIQTANIVPPTAQNQAAMEYELKIALEEFGLDRPQAELQHYGEWLVRNYDPCISCATHFMRLKRE